MKPKHKPLTKAEEAVMQALWPLEKAFTKDVIARMPEPKPHYNTVSTLLKILQEKGFVTSRTVGNATEFTPAISRDEYSRKAAKSLLGNYFDGSVARMVSFFAGEQELDVKELEAVLKTIAGNKKAQP